MTRDEACSIFIGQGFNKGESARAWREIIRYRGTADNVTMQDISGRIHYMKFIIIPCKNYKIPLTKAKTLSKYSNISLENSVNVLKHCVEKNINIDWFMKMFKSKLIAKANEGVQVSNLIYYIDVMKFRYGYIPSLISEVTNSRIGCFSEIENEFFKKTIDCYGCIDKQVEILGEILKEHGFNISTETIEKKLRYFVEEK